MRFYSKELLAPRPTPKLEDHPLSAVRDYLFNTFAATLHIGGRYSIRNLSTRHAVVTGTLYNQGQFVFIYTKKRKGMASLSKVYPDRVRVYMQVPDRWQDLE